MKRTLSEWLSWQEKLHFSEIDLGLERIGQVAGKMGILSLPFPVITVAGTNGKGSCIAMLNSILTKQGYKTGVYTSPHLVRYNERIAINHCLASDTDICAVFDKINTARGKTSLTYFEFGALAAMLIFIRQQVDVALLEVGLGGRLDAVNLWAPSVAIITGIAIDHENWLGTDREKIAIEKAGIMRHERPVICGDKNPPNSIASEARRLNAHLFQINRDFKYSQHTGQISPPHGNCGEMEAKWQWTGWDGQSFTLPLPALNGTFQLNNASTVVAGLMAIKSQLPVTETALESGLCDVRLAGRMQIIHQNPEWLIDVSHNPQSAEQLAKFLVKNPVKDHHDAKTHAVFSMLADKDIQQVINLLDPLIDEWHIFQLPGSRSITIDSLMQLMNNQPLKGDIVSYDNFEVLCKHLKKKAKSKDRVVAFGSFLVVSCVLEMCNFSV